MRRLLGYHFPVCETPTDIPVAYQKSIIIESSIFIVSCMKVS